MRQTSSSFSRKARSVSCSERSNFSTSAVEQLPREALDQALKTECWPQEETQIPFGNDKQKAARSFETGLNQTFPRRIQMTFGGSFSSTLRSAKSESFDTIANRFAFAYAHTPNRPPHPTAGREHVSIRDRVRLATPPDAEEGSHRIEASRNQRLRLPLAICRAHRPP
jgi:hypothetical protein